MDKRLRAEAQRYRYLYSGAIILATAADVIVIVQAAFLARIITLAFLDKQPLNSLVVWFIALALTIGVRALLTWSSSAVSGELAIRIKLALREKITAHITALGPAFTAGERSGELTNALTEGIESLDAYFREYLPAIYTAVLVPLIFLVVVLPMDGLTFVVMLITAPLIPLFMVLIGMAAGALARSQYGEMSLLSAHFLDVMQGLPTLKLFNRSAYQIQTIGRISDQFRAATMKVLRIAFLSAFALELLATLSVAVVAVEIGLRLLRGNLAFEPALFLLMIAPDYYQPLRTLGARFHSSTESKAAATRLFEILDTPLPVPVSDGTEQLPITLDGQSLDIQLHNLRFAYGNRVVLNDINVTIPPRQHVAIVGTSGSGKSTLVALLMRFDQPTAGKMMVGNIDLLSLDVAQWRQQIAWVGQNPYLFNTTIAENIRVGRPDAPMDDVIAAAKLAQAHDFITQLPDSYETLCGERGMMLSGGQAQRIALARAFLRNAPILIFDEATAQLDPTTEHIISQTIDAMHDKTVIFIAHRLRTITNADQIIVLENGEVAESGTHAELWAMHGVYHRMVAQNEQESQYEPPYETHETISS